MCGIFAILNSYSFEKEFLNEQFMKGKHRGPELSKLNVIDNTTTIGFHRLAINGLDEESNQPMTIDDITLICNGEIYNYKELFDMLNVSPVTNSDCEVIIHMYKTFGICQTLQMLDGVFAFILIDRRERMDVRMYIARDPYGVRPLYMMTHYSRTGSRKRGEKASTSPNQRQRRNTFILCPTLVICI